MKSNSQVRQNKVIYLLTMDNRLTGVDIAFITLVITSLVKYKYLSPKLENANYNEYCDTEIIEGMTGSLKLN
jgi:hypothetical protein